ncbi:hypothetical protein phiHau3_51 [Streptomyces phage phiHau3]|uniref:Uncharacterized protein n=1 Tax=Streptomyces phage phiHau3 TaxID=1204524 RepID=K4HYN0_9CAUD|nr:hypothetical protein phiHau3_51 [Streptomyces phage phiHau3]AFU62028.1 hypothetical protein phiHau3_51 [Streptomyces phage phiHau3]
MAHSARDRLSEMMERHGNDGRLLIFHDEDDPCGTTAEGADLPPLARLEPTHPELSARVKVENARSRGELL